MTEKIWLVVLCLSGWNISTCLLHQFHYVADSKTWTEAQVYCRETYTDLATTENTEEMNQLINTVSSFGYNPEVWIGLYIRIDWRWSDGYNGSGAGYWNWETRTNDEPDFYSYSQYCVTFGSAGGWWDDFCWKNFPFICYRGTQMDPEFVVVTQRMTWSSAQRYCRENFIDLATVRNHTDNQEIQSLVPTGESAWIGLFRDPHIYWSDGSGYSFNYWSASSHPYLSTSVICGLAALYDAGKWRTRSCETGLPFVCYSIPPAPVKRQVVKLKMQPDDPSVDLSDPAVKADILKKLQDRLKEKRVSGVTLKWRKQPDGKVFHKEEKRNSEW